jgi:hypothetical protein
LKANLAVLIGISLMAPSYAGPPFVTDDPEPVEYQRWEVNYALSATHAQGQTLAFLPGIDANYGAAPGLQLHVQPQLAYANASTGRTYGLGDTEVGIKYRVTPASDRLDEWTISLYPRYEFPTGNANRNLGTGSSSLYLPMWLQTTRAGWTTYGGGGYWVNSGAGNRNAWAAGWVALYQFTEKLQIGGEVFAKTADTADGRGSSGFNLGGTYGLAADYSVLFSAGRGLNNATSTNQASVYVAL